MAFDAKDIAHLKARVPHDYRPSHEADGTLSNAFYAVDMQRESIALQGKHAHETNLQRHNMGMAIAGNPDAAGASFILTGAAASAKYAHTAQEERKKREAEDRYVIDLIVAQIDARNRQIAENLVRLGELKKQETALQDHLERLRRGEKVQLDVDGHLKDTNAEAAIQEFEDRYGVTVDRTDAEAIAIILQGVKDEQLQIVRENEVLADENERDRQIAIDMGADPASIPATVIKLEQTAAGQRSVDKAAAEMRDNVHRKQVAESIATDPKDHDLVMDSLDGAQAALNENEAASSSAMDVARLKLPLPK